MDIWTIYHNPSDFPGLYVVRRSTVGAAGIVPDKVASVASTLEEARRFVPPGLVFIARQSADDPVIVEVWL